MLKKPRDFNAAECMVWMYANNPNKVDLHMPRDFPRYLISLVPIDQLKFPEGWYYSQETKTINNNKSTIRFNVIIKE